MEVEKSVWKYVKGRQNNWAVLTDLRQQVHNSRRKKLNRERKRRLE
jgi:hypothetical protein